MKTMSRAFQGCSIGFAACTSKFVLRLFFIGAGCENLEFRDCLILCSGENFYFHWVVDVDVDKCLKIKLISIISLEGQRNWENFGFFNGDFCNNLSLYSCSSQLTCFWNFDDQLMVAFIPKILETVIWTLTDMLLCYHRLEQEKQHSTQSTIFYKKKYLITSSSL